MELEGTPGFLENHLGFPKIVVFLLGFPRWVVSLPQTAVASKKERDAVHLPGHAETTAWPARG